MSIYLITAAVTSDVVLPIEADNVADAGAMATELIETGNYEISGRPEQGCVVKIEHVQDWTKSADGADKRTAKANSEHYQELMQEHDDNQ